MPPFRSGPSLGKISIF